MAGRLRKLFTDEEVKQSLEEASMAAASAKLTSLKRGIVSPELVLYWSRQLTEVTKKNGDPYISTVAIDRKIRKGITLRRRSKEDDLGKIGRGQEDNSRIIAVPDLHAPYHHVDSIAFLSALDDYFHFTRVICLGDETDNHALSFHDSDPNLDSAGTELNEARKVLNELHSLFPVMDLCHSNHGSLVYRRALKTGIPVEMIKTYREILFPQGGGEGWQWDELVRLQLPNGEDCLFKHECTGDILNNAAHERANLVQGHRHSQWTIQGKASDAALYWAMIPGCLIDRKTRAFEYGKLNLKRPAIGVGLIINSLPMLVPMQLDKHGRWTGRLEGTL